MFDELQNKVAESGLLLGLLVIKHAVGLIALFYLKRSLNYCLFACVAAVIFSYSMIHFTLFDSMVGIAIILAAIFIMFIAGGAWLFLSPESYLTRPATKKDWYLIFIISVICSAAILSVCFLYMGKNYLFAGFEVTLVLAAIHEEFVYRFAIPNAVSYVIKTKYRAANIILPFIISSVLFVLMHEHSSYEWLAIASAIYSFVAYRFGLTYAILTHMLWNTFFGVLSIL